MSIVVKGAANPTTRNSMKLEAFPRPGTDEVIEYELLKGVPSYAACLVRVQELTPAGIKFYGVNREDGSDIKDGDTAKLHAVPLRAEYVWHLPPSTLAHVNKAGNDYAVLLVNTAYVDQNKPFFQAALADPPNKWPIGKEKFNVFRERLKALAERKDNNQAMLEAIERLIVELT